MNSVFKWQGQFIITHSCLTMLFCAVMYDMACYFEMKEVIYCKILSKIPIG